MRERERGREGERERGREGERERGEREKGMERVLKVVFYIKRHATVAAATTLHNAMLTRLLRAPMYFFDTTPIGTWCHLCCVYGVYVMCRKCWYGWVVGVELRACTYVRVCVCAYVRMCVCAYVRMCVCAYVRMWCGL
jgi:hypothetical protein